MNRFRKCAVLCIAVCFPALGAFAAPNTVQFSPTTYTVNENAGTVTVNVTAQRLGSSSDQISVTYTTRDGTARAADGDYVPKTGTIAFGPGETFKQIMITILQDTVLENAENFFVDLSDPQGATINDSGKTATITIADDDNGSSTFQFSSANYSVNEGDGKVTVTVVRSGGVQLVASVNYATSDNTAKAGSDYTAVSGTLTFNPGETSKTFDVPIINDSFVETSENFSLNLSSPSFGSTVASPSSATVTIADDDGGSIVRFNPTSYSVNEAAGTVTLTVVADRLGNASDVITVDYATRDGSAVSGQDYLAKTGSIVFDSGQTQQQITIQIINDNSLENAENFFVDLSNAQGASLQSGSATATVSIADDDTGSSTIQFSSAAYSVNEGAGSVALTVVRSGGIQFAASVNYSTANGTAVAGSDYTAASGSLNFAPGETQKTITIGINEDSLVEGDENFTVTLSGPSSGAALGSPSTATVTIVDNDSGSTVQFNPTTYTVNEAAGQVVLTVTLSRLGDPNTPVNVSYATRDGSATAGQDYSQQSGTIVFGSGETQKQIVIGIINDTLLENPENFFVDLNNPGNASIAASGSTATVTIADDDSGTSTIQFDSSTYSVNENGGSATLRVVRSGGIGQTVTVNYASADGTATAGLDYTAVSGTLTFTPGVTQQTITVPITDDAFVEGNETFTVTLSNPSAAATLGTPASATVTIVDNDSGGNTVQFDPTSYTVNEAAGTVTLTITASRFGNPNVPITVKYATRDGSATAAQDYSAVSGTVTFNSGETQKQITVPITNDNLIENAETFFVDLSNPSNANITGNAGTATVTIADDDSGTSTIQFDSSTYSVNENGGSATLRVVRSGGIGQTVTVNYASADGTATAGSDYTAVSGTLTFSPGVTQQTITVPIINDSVVEPNENFTVTLSNPSAGAALGTPATATVTIVDNDGGGNTLQFDPTTYATSETPGGSVVTLTITATRFGNPTTPISVHYDTRNGSATVATGDYVAAAGTVTFGPGETQKTISINVLDDTTIEGAENFFVDLTNASNASIAPSGQTATITIADDDAGTSTIQFGSTNFGVGEGDGTMNLTVVRSGGLGFTVSARYGTADQTAHAGSDYAQTSGTVTFAPGQFSKTISIPIFQDALVEETETFTVTLSNPSVNAAIGSPSTTTVSIFDDDPADNTTKLANISTRGPVESGNDVMIAGFIIQGSSFKQLVLRGLGPSLTALGVADAVDDPTLALLDSNGNQLASNDDYTTNSAADQAVLTDTGLTPPNSHESAIIFTALPGNYTAILRGKTNGIGTVEVYDVNQTEHARLANISTRAKVEPGDNGALIAGFIVTAPEGQPGTVQTVAIRAIGPSLKSFGINNALADTTLDLYRGSQLILSNDNWQTNSQTNQQTLKANGLAPANDKESAIITTLDAGSYSAVVRGKGNTTGVALVEVYNLTP